HHLSPPRPCPRSPAPCTPDVSAPICRCRRWFRTVPPGRNPRKNGASAWWSRPCAGRNFDGDRCHNRGGTMTATETLRYIDSDGHILEHPTGMLDYAPAKYRDRIWHIETDEQGVEWLHYNGTVLPANFMAAAGTAGMSDEDRAKSFRGELRYTEVRP